MRGHRGAGVGPRLFAVGAALAVLMTMIMPAAATTTAGVFYNPSHDSASVRHIADAGFATCGSSFIRIRFPAVYPTLQLATYLPTDTVNYTPSYYGGSTIGGFGYTPGISVETYYQQIDFWVLIQRWNGSSWVNYGNPVWRGPYQSWPAAVAQPSLPQHLEVKFLDSGYYRVWFAVHWWPIVTPRGSDHQHSWIGYRMNQTRDYRQQLAPRYFVPSDGPYCQVT